MLGTSDNLNDRQKAQLAATGACPVRLTPEQRARAAQSHDRWLDSLRRMATDVAAHPEDRANAQALLRNRGL